MTVEAAWRRGLHVTAASLFYEMATDGPFGPRNPAMALQAACAMYKAHGWELLGTEAEDLPQLAAAAYAGEVAEEDVAAAFRERATELAANAR